MFQINRVTSDPKQKQTLLATVGPIVLRLRFIPMQLCWTISELNYKDFTLNNVRIANSPNMLHQYRNQIPFGLACFSDGKREPSLQEDFSSGASILYLLTSSEVTQYTEYLAGA